ncbi:MAG: hypothetical protein OXI74_08465 [Rhodospirillaceae bacterium]|nr:hypothetical protein [Rhodospirillaceae bacterium]
MWERASGVAVTAFCLTCMPAYGEDVDLSERCYWAEELERESAETIDMRKLPVVRCRKSSAVCQVSVRKQRRRYQELAAVDEGQINQFRMIDAQCGTRLVELTMATSEMATRALGVLDKRYPEQSPTHERKADEDALHDPFRETIITRVVEPCIVQTMRGPLGESLDDDTILNLFESVSPQLVGMLADRVVSVLEEDPELEGYSETQWDAVYRDAKGTCERALSDIMAGR